MKAERTRKLDSKNQLKIKTKVENVRSLNEK